MHAVLVHLELTFKYYGADTQSRNLHKFLAQVSCIKFSCKFMQVLVWNRAVLYSVQETCRRKNIVQETMSDGQVSWTCISFLYKFLDCVSPTLQWVTSLSDLDFR